MSRTAVLNVKGNSKTRQVGQRHFLWWIKRKTLCFTEQDIINPTSGEACDKSCQHKEEMSISCSATGDNDSTLLFQLAAYMLKEELFHCNANLAG